MLNNSLHGSALMTHEKRLLVTWEQIANYLPSKPSVRTLQRKWKELEIPIKTDLVTGKRIVEVEELNTWIRKNPKKI